MLLQVVVSASQACTLHANNILIKEKREATNFQKNEINLQKKPHKKYSSLQMKSTSTSHSFTQSPDFACVTLLAKRKISK